MYYKYTVLLEGGKLVKFNPILDILTIITKMKCGWHVDRKGGSRGVNLRNFFFAGSDFRNDATLDIL